MSQHPSEQGYLQQAKLNLFEVANWHGLLLSSGGGVCRIERPGSYAILIADDNARIITHLISLFDRYIGMLEPTGFDGKQAVFDFTKPRLHRFRNSDLQFWFASIPEDAYPVPGYLSRRKPRKGESTLDIGACSGVTSYFFAKLVGPTGRVFAYEPDALNFELLERNIALHGLENVTPIMQAVWTKTGKMRFMASGGTIGGVGEGEACIDVPAVSLEDAVRNTSDGTVGLVKMDVEGAEVDIIDASRDFIRSRDLHFAIASYHIVGTVTSSVILERTFKECGYETKTGFPLHPTTWAWPKASNNR